MKKRLLIALAPLLLFSSMSTSVLASGSSGRGGGGPSFGGSSVDPFLVTETIKGVVTAIDRHGILTVRSRKTKKTLRFQVHEKTDLTAQDKGAFGGRKKLGPSDLAVGQQLKIVIREFNGKLLRIKVLKG